MQVWVREIVGVGWVREYYYRWSVLYHERKLRSTVRRMSAQLKRSAAAVERATGMPYEMASVYL